MRLRPQIVLVMQSRRTRSSSSRRSHSPPNPRRLPTVPRAAEETPPGASPASSWVESAFFFSFFFLGQFFSFYFFKDKCPTALFLHIRPSRAALHSFHTLPSPHPPLCPPLTLPFLSFFSIKTNKKKLLKALYVSPPLLFFQIGLPCSASRLLGKA